MPAVLREFAYRGKTYHLEGVMPIGDTPSDIAFAVANVKVQVLCGAREHGAYHWRTLANGPKKTRVINAYVNQAR